MLYLTFSHHVTRLGCNRSVGTDRLDTTVFNSISEPTIVNSLLSAYTDSCLGNMITGLEAHKLNDLEHSGDNTMHYTNNTPHTRYTGDLTLNRFQYRPPERNDTIL